MLTFLTLHFFSFPSMLQPVCSPHTLGIGSKVVSTVRNKDNIQCKCWNVAHMLKKQINVHTVSMHANKSQNKCTSMHTFSQTSAWASIPPRSVFLSWFYTHHPACACTHKHTHTLSHTHKNTGITPSVLWMISLSAEPHHRRGRSAPLHQRAL